VPLAVAALAAAILAVVIAAVALRPGPERRVPSAAAPTQPTPTTTPPTTPATTPASTPITPAGFPSTDCKAAPMATGGALGVGVPRPARLYGSPAETQAFNAAVGCLRAIGGGQAPVLRTQIPIDVGRRAGPGDNEMAELDAFAALLQANGASGIVSIRAHDFTRCGKDGAPSPHIRTALQPGEALQSCEYPSIGLYGQLFTEVRDLLAAKAPGVTITWTAWNEPDHPMFTLQPAVGMVGAARLAGQYWSVAAGLVGPDHVLAGEFADNDLPTLLRLRKAFVTGAGVDPPAWAIHPYRDLTAGTRDHVVDGFTAAVAPAPVWLTEVTARLSGRGGISGEAAIQRARGTQLRATLEREPMRVVLYLLTPPAPPRTTSDDDWDSALADRQGRARPFVCGLADLPDEACPGDVNAFGG
jgi:hypothetical protein